MEVPDYKDLKSKVSDREYELPSHEEDKRDQQQLLELSEKDLQIYESIKEKDESMILNPGKLGNGMTEEEVLVSLEKLYRNGKVRKEFDDGNLVYKSWDVSAYN